MNLGKLPNWQKGLALLVLIIAIALIVYFQIDGAQSASKTESALFNVIQFIFSIAFAWMLSAFIGESQFVESQRKFAIGAFRRIKEIERSINRTQKYVRHLENGADEITRCKVVAVKGGLSAMQDTVRSSIADWSDIIGDEIHIAHEIEKLKKIRVESEDISTKDEEQSLTSNEVERARMLTQLTASLPKELANDLDFDEVDPIDEVVSNLAQDWAEDKKTSLRCFWELNSGFGSDLSGIKTGDRVCVARGMTEDRRGVLMLFNELDQQIAVVTNGFACKYDVFVEAMEEFYGRGFIPKVFGGAPLTAIVKDIEEYEHDKERQYLTVTIEQNPQHRCVFEEYDGNA